MNKLVIAAAALILAAPSTLSAQGETALSFTTGWKFGGSMSVREGDLSVAASEHFGAELAIRASRDGSIILLVDYQPTVLRLKDFRTGIREELFDMDVWYFMLGGQGEINDRGPIVPFGTAALGVAWFNPTGTIEDRSSTTMFSGMFGGGVRVPLGQGDKVDFRLEGRMHLNIPWGGASFWCGSGGCYGGVGGYVGPVQGTVMAGLRLKMGP
jgi:hypothetical protein